LSDFCVIFSHSTGSGSIFHEVKFQHVVPCSRRCVVYIETTVITAATGITVTYLITALRHIEVISDVILLCKCQQQCLQHQHSFTEFDWFM